MHFRVAQKTDSITIQKIYQFYVENTTITFDYEVPNVADFERLVEKTLVHYPFFVCEIKDKVVGYAYAHSYMEKAAYQWSSVLTVYLDKDYTGYGIGQGLYQSLIDSLSLQNFENIYACVTFPNDKSQKLHESFGFKKVGTFKKAGFKNGSWYDINWFEKKVSIYEKEPKTIIPFRELTSETISNILEKNCKSIQINKK